MNVLTNPDTCTLLGPRIKARDFQLRSEIARKHRPIPERMYVVGTTLYIGIVVTVAGALSWAFLILVLSPT